MRKISAPAWLTNRWKWVDGVCLTVLGVMVGMLLEEAVTDFPTVVKIAIAVVAGGGALAARWAAPPQAHPFTGMQVLGFEENSLSMPGDCEAVEFCLAASYGPSSLPELELEPAHLVEGEIIGNRISIRRRDSDQVRNPILIRYSVKWWG